MVCNVCDRNITGVAVVNHITGAAWCRDNGRGFTCAPFEVVEKMLADGLWTQPTANPTPARTRATTIPEGAAERKQYPIASGALDYFPDALVAIARVSWQGNQQHHPDKPLFWDRSKSTDEADALMRHFLQRGTVDSDGIRHTAKLAWRALAMLQKEIEDIIAQELSLEDGMTFREGK